MHERIEVVYGRIEGCMNGLRGVHGRIEGCMNGLRGCIDELRIASVTQRIISGKWP